MAIQLNDNIRINAGKPAESKYLNTSGAPYTSTSQVTSQVALSERHIGLTVNINNVEYWFATGVTNSDLVIKTDTNSITGGTNGLSITGRKIKLGGTITGNTNIIVSSGTNLTFLQNANSKFNISGSTGFNFSWDVTNKRFSAGNNLQVTGGSINYTFGDTNTNAGTFGSVMFGELSYIDSNVGSALAVGEGVWIRAYGGKAIGRGTRVNVGGNFGFVGGVWTVGSTDPKTNNKVPQVGGLGSFGFYSTDGSQTDNHGALANYSAILGGLNHNIPSNSTASVVIGGNSIKVSTGITNTVHLPKVRIGLGTSASIVTNNSNNNLLVRNSTTGEIEIRDASTLTGGTTGSTITAGNGLSRVVDEIRLGGTLSLNTTVSGNGFNLNLGQNSNRLSNFRTWASGSVAIDGNTGALMQSSGSTVQISPTSANFIAANIGRITFDVTALNIKDDRVSKAGLQYDSNYASGFTSRSIPDVEWVDNAIQLAITGITGSSPQNIYSLKRIVNSSTILDDNDFVVFCSGSTSFTLSAPVSPVDGQVFKIKDVSGNASVNIITIDGNGKNIDGSSTVQINTDRGGIEMCYDATLDFWSVMNFVG